MPMVPTTSALFYDQIPQGTNQGHSASIGNARGANVTYVDEATGL